MPSRLESAAEAARRRCEELAAKGLQLDMTRGKPSSEQLDLSAGLLDSLASGTSSEGGTDCRNYGGVEGLPEARRWFAELLQAAPEQVLIGDNSSLGLMFDTVSQALHHGVPGSPRPWSHEERIRFVCPCPGYDRHFQLLEFLGIEPVPVDLDDDGPDLEALARLAADDPTVKGMFCVPRYSNPTGITYSDEVVRALASVETAAPDFRILWDNAYSVHHLEPDPSPLLPLLAESERAGNGDRPFVFASTSKITFAGAGISAMACSRANLDWVRAFRSKKTIGPDKLNQLRHVRFLPDRAALTAHMVRHAELLRPRFAVVDEVLTAELGGLEIASWTRPRGGYFISLDTPDGCARLTIERAAELGVKLTPAGATFPGGIDPRDRNIRIAPSFPPVAELRLATEVLALSLIQVAASVSRRGA